MTTLIETVRIRGGRAPLWTRHLERLERSSRELGFGIPAVPEPIGGEDRVVRIEIMPGTHAPRITERPVGDSHPVRLIVGEEPHPWYPHKTSDREGFELALAEARGQGADDAVLLTKEGWVAEACIWTLFWWEGERLVTPPLNLGILPGVGRARIAEIGAGFEQRRVVREDLVGKSLFVANSVRGIVPVARLGGKRVPDSGLTAEVAGGFWP